MNSALARRFVLRRAFVGGMTCVLLSLGASAVHADIVYSASGNGNSGFGGVLGTGSLSIDNTTSGSLAFTFTKGAGNLSDAVVIYLQSGTAATFNDTSSFSDTADDLRKAISGFDGGNRSTLNFNGTNGLAANYAIAFNQGFGGLWQLQSGGPNSLAFVRSVNLSPTGSATSPTYSFSMNVSDIGLTANSGASFKFFATYLNPTNVFRSNEAFGGGFSGSNPGYTTVTMDNAQTVVTVPEPASHLLLVFGLAAPGYFSLRRRLRGRLAG